MSWNWLRLGCRTGIGLLLVFGLFLAVDGFLFLAELPLTLAFGWPVYLYRIVPQLKPDPWSVVSAIVCLVALVLGSHAFLRWLYAASSTEPRQWPWKRTLQLVGLVVLMFVSGIAVTGMIHQTGWLIRSREPLVEGGVRVAAARAISANNLKQIGLAVHNYKDSSEDSVLPRSQFDSYGRPMHSWQTALLPYIEQDRLYREINRSKPWTDLANAEPMSTPIKQFRNPSVEQETVNGFGISHYAGNVQVVLGDKPKTMHSFPHGTSNTILAGEVPSNFRAWGDPLNARDPRLGANGHPHGFGGPNGRPAQFVMLDGSVRTFDPKELADLVGKVPE